jgi:hypothetical protein
MKNLKTYTALTNMGACYAGRDWAAMHGGTFAELWRDCPRGDWMAWYIANRNGYQRSRPLLAALVEIAALAVKHLEDNRSKKAFKTLKAYLAGKATKEDLAKGRSLADDAFFDEPIGANAERAAATILECYDAIHNASGNALTIVDRVLMLRNNDKRTNSRIADILRKHIPEI